MANDHLSVRLDPRTGGVCSLVDRATGREWLDASGGAWPTFRGIGDPRALPEHSWSRWFPGVDRDQPVVFDTSAGKAALTWLADGPACATLRAFHDGPLLKFETHVTLAAHSPCVEVTTRILCHVPPLLDELHEGWPMFSSDIRNGYWLDLQPAIRASRLVRDYPLGVEPTDRATFHALTFADLLDRDGGLLVLHPGTQYFSRQADGRLRNLLVREWESFYSREYGWPRCCEYRHALMPHGPQFTNADRLHAATEFTSPMTAVVHRGGRGGRPSTGTALAIEPDSAQLLALRRTTDEVCELRVLECEGKAVAGCVQLPVPPGTIQETDLIGRPLTQAEPFEDRAALRLAPWHVHTYQLRPQR